MNIALKNVIRYPKLYYNLLKKRIFLKNIAFARILKYSYNIFENLIRTLLECNRAEYRCIKIIKEIQVNPTFSRYFKSLAWTCTKSFSRSSLRGRKLIRGIARAISHPLSSSIPSFFFFHWVVHTFTDPNPERYYSRHDCPRDFKARHCPGLE